jgi:hypothetical protein
VHSPPPYQFRDSAIGFGALALLLIGSALVLREWPYGVAAVAAAAVAAAAWWVHVWWQRRFDEWHPYGVDLFALQDEPADKVANVLAAARRARAGDVIAEADRLADALRTQIDPLPLLSPEMATARDQRLGIEGLVASRLAALTMGALPDESWCDDVDRKMLDAPNWRGYWPERARIVDSSLRLLRSVTPA